MKKNQQEMQENNKEKKKDKQKKKITYKNTRYSNEKKNLKNL